MTWQGGKKPTDAAASAVKFAPLRPLITGPNVDLGMGLKNASQALRDFGSQVHIHVQFVTPDAAAGEKVDHWGVDGGTPDATAHQGRPASADVHIVMRPETWTQIAMGQLAPYDALFGGTLRIGGNLDTAKRIVQHLSDPKVPYLPPC